MSRAGALFAPLLIACLACASRPEAGIMEADWTPPEDSGIAQQRVTIAWESRKPTVGSMTFTLGRGGQRYVGSYLLLEQNRSEVQAEPLYQIWQSASFETWSATGANPWFVPGWDLDVWIQHYDGRVVVGLHGNSGGSARCHFTLADTDVGIPGGGTGECQVSDGGHMAVRF